LGKNRLIFLPFFGKNYQKIGFKENISCLSFFDKILGTLRVSTYHKKKKIFVGRTGEHLGLCKKHFL